LLHDIGTWGFPSTSCRNRAGSPTPSSGGSVHPESAPRSSSRSVPYWLPLILAHHERWDGRGYPRSSGSDIRSERASCRSSIVSWRCWRPPHRGREPCRGHCHAA
jgi:hypothetical protein